MCARYSISKPVELLAERFGVIVPKDIYQPRYNASPTQLMPIITTDSPKELLYYQWGLIPSWSEDESIGSRLFNARAETIDEKPSFRGPFKRKRCLIPADGFYEWDKGHNPYRFTLKNDDIFAFAGISETWESGDNIVDTFTIITTGANKAVGQVHERMPVILRPEDESFWLNYDSNMEAIKSLLKPFDDKLMNCFPVDRLVNNAKNDIPEVLLPRK